MGSVFIVLVLWNGPSHKACPHWWLPQWWFFNLASFFLSLALLGNPWNTGKMLLQPLTTPFTALHGVAPAHLSDITLPPCSLCSAMEAVRLGLGTCTCCLSAWDMFLPDLCLLAPSFHPGSSLGDPSPERAAFTLQPKRAPNPLTSTLHHRSVFYLLHSMYRSLKLLCSSICL